MKVGGTEIHILFLGRGHTGGDLEVFLPRENVLWMSETFFNRIYPSVGGNRSGHPLKWLETVKKAKAMKAGLYVPNHGFIDSPAVLNEEMDNFVRVMENLVSESRRLHAAKVSIEDAPAPDQPRRVPVLVSGRQQPARLDPPDLSRDRRQAAAVEQVVGCRLSVVSREPALLALQRDDRRDPHRPPRGDVAGRRGHHGQGAPTPPRTSADPSAVTPKSRFGADAAHQRARRPARSRGRRR